MKQILKRDWEMIRIFLVLALLTIGFVWVVQSLILTPTTTPHIQGYSLGGEPATGRESDKDGAVLGKLGILPLSLSPSLSTQQILERSPAALPKHKRK